MHSPGTRPPLSHAHFPGCSAVPVRRSPRMLLFQFAPASPAAGAFKAAQSRNIPASICGCCRSVVLCQLTAPAEHRRSRLASFYLRAPQSTVCENFAAQPCHSGRDAYLLQAAVLECRCAEFHQPGGQCDLSQISAAIKRSCTDSPQRFGQLYPPEILHPRKSPRSNLLHALGYEHLPAVQPGFLHGGENVAAASPVSIVLLIVTSSDSRGNMSLMRLSKCQTLSLQPLI